MAASERAAKVKNSKKKAGRAGFHGAVKKADPPPPIPAEDWEDGAISVKRAAQILDVTPRSVFNLMTKGDLRWAPLGRERRIPRRDVIRLLSPDARRVG